MTPILLDWIPKGGLSRFLQESEIRLRPSGDRVKALLELSPHGLKRRVKPVDFEFELSGPVRGRFPGGVRFRLGPEARLQGRILFPGNAFLGNFRVRSGFYAIQWSLRLEIEGTASLRGLGSASAGTRLSQSWVCEIPEELAFEQGLRLSWERFINLLSVRQVEGLPEGSVHRLVWTGRLRSRIEVSWQVQPGFTIPVESRILSVRGNAGVEAGLSSSVTLHRSGTFQLQLSHRRGRTRMTLRRESDSGREVSIRAGVGADVSARVTDVLPLSLAADKSLLEPLRRVAQRELNRQVAGALARRLEVSASLQLQRRSTRTRVVAAEWEKATPWRVVKRDYSLLLKGSLPPPRTDLKVTGSLVDLKEKKVHLRLNVLDWLKLRRRKTDRQQVKFSHGADGQILVERERSIEKIHETRHSRQMMALVLSRNGNEEDYLWTLQRKGRFRRRSLMDWLRLGLHAGILPEVKLPARPEFPMRLELLFSTRFSRSGIEEARLTSEEDVWTTLIRTLEIRFPDRYGKSRYWRDWADFPEVREAIDADPVAAHRRTVYPLAGRSQAQRRRVVSEYLKARRFAGGMEKWRNHREVDAVRLLAGWDDVTAFLYLHRRCPRSLRRSGALLTGDLQANWGDPDLLGS